MFNCSVTSQNLLRFVAGSIVIAISSSVVCLAAEQSDAPAEVLIVVGAGGEEEFTNDFRVAASEWQKACNAGKLRYKTIGLETTTPSQSSHRDQLLKELDAWSHVSEDQLQWLVMIGHGTSSKQASNFNLHGDDVSLKEIKQTLEDCSCKMIIAACFSTSGAWMPELTSQKRIIVTSTKSATEYNYSRFAKYFAESINDPSIDLDHDREVSLLEAFLSASRRTDRYYEDDGRLASEHAMLDDNGDGKGTTADFYQGLEKSAIAKDTIAVDGQNARRVTFVRNATTLQLTSDELQLRDELEEELRMLRDRKNLLDEDAYYKEMESIFRRLASVYADGDPQGNLP